VRYGLLLVISWLLAACGTRGPVYPDPAPHEAQLVVQLHGEPREGVRRPARRTVREGYTTRLVTDEDGAAFERVDYSRIEDVVVLVHPLSFAGKHLPASWTETLDIEFTDEGFSRMQYLGDRTGHLRVHNHRTRDVTIFGHSELEEFFERLIPAGGSAVIDLQVNLAGPLDLGRTFELYCEEDETARARLFVVGRDSQGWIGNSDEEAFFVRFVTGSPVSVHVYAPRLPVWHGTAELERGTRTTIQAQLSVNLLSD
jgi:predicted small lipoprotein YifL